MISIYVQFDWLSIKDAFIYLYEILNRDTIVL